MPDRDSKPRDSRGMIHISIGLAIFTTGVWGLWKDIGWIAQPFYAYAWWGYIFVLDGYVYVRRGHSLLTRSRKHVLPVLVWSVTFWYFFELLNLRYQNWYYVGVAHNLFLGFLFSVICFSTVFIGMFETYESLTASGVWVNWQGKRGGKFPRWVSYAVQGLGLVMVTLSLVFSTYLAPLVWGSVTFLIDPWNYRRGARSLLRDFEERDWGLVARLLLGGLICGAFWESMNFFAPQKWIYTVRGLENLKLFEMPLLGFLGFPALALDGMAVYSFLSYWFLGNETWETPSDIRYKLVPHPPLSRISFTATIPLQVVFCGLVLFGVRSVNMASTRLDLGDVSTLNSEAREKLEAEGIKRPIRLFRSASDPETRSKWEDSLGYSREQFQRVLDEARLLAFKGIGVYHGKLLNRIGIHRVEDLSQEEPEDLHRKILAVADEKETFPRPPRLDIVRVWVYAARSQGIVQRAS